MTTRRMRGERARSDGGRAEFLAAWFLRLKGWRIVARNLRTPVGEIDLVARRGRTLAVVEVKRRGAGADPGAAISATQRGRIARATGWLLQRQPDLATLDLRYDAVLLSPRGWPRHVVDAWRLCLVLTIAAAGAACTPVGMVVGAGATAGVGVAQDRGIGGALRDTDLQATLNARWLEASAGLFNQLGSIVHEGRILVVGRVDSDADRQRGIAIARGIEGAVEVIDEIQVAPQGRTVDYVRDISILTTLRTRLTLDGRVRAVNYALDCVGGTIYLMGVARSAEELERVVGHARDLRGVRRVASHVRVRAADEPTPEPPPPVQRRAPVESQPL